MSDENVKGAHTPYSDALTALQSITPTWGRLSGWAQDLRCTAVANFDGWQNKACRNIAYNLSQIEQLSHEVEVSLRALRDNQEGIVDGVINEVDAYPDGES